jgi:hypothetical protein
MVHPAYSHSIINATCLQQGLLRRRDNLRLQHRGSAWGEPGRHMMLASL